MRMGLMGRKLGMSQLFDDNDNMVPVTIVQANPNVVLQVKTPDIDGYWSVKLGFEEIKPARVNRPDAGQFKAADCSPRRYVRELRVDEDPGAELAVGKEITVTAFSTGDKIDVVGTSKGHGFTGVMRRHNFKGSLEGHGTHEFFRHGGSIGMNMTPAHTRKGMKMPGQMGQVRVTTQNLTVVKVDADKNLLYIRGAIPGARQGLVFVRHAVKKTLKT